MTLLQYTKDIPVLEPNITVAPLNIQFYPFHDLLGIQTIRIIPHDVQSPKSPNTSSPTEEDGTGAFNESKKSLSPVLGIRKQSKTIGAKRGLWSDNEHQLFLKGYDKHGRNWSLIAKEFVSTRTRQQVRSHAQKFFKKSSDDESGEEEEDEIVNKEF